MRREARESKLLFCRLLSSSASTGIALDRHIFRTHSRSERLHGSIGTRRITMAHAEIAWQQDLETALKEARTQQKPVLLDFSAAPM